MLVVLQMFSPDYISVLYETLTGRFIMTAAMALMALAYVWSLKITKVEV
jgi:Flp pilus assembly protein TadB